MSTDRFHIKIESDPLIEVDGHEQVANVRVEIKGTPHWAAAMIDQLLETNPEIATALAHFQLMKLMGMRAVERQGESKIDNTPPTDTIN